MKILRALYVFIFILSIYLGINLVGWGLSDLSGFSANPARLGYAGVVIGFALLCGIQSYHSLAGIQDGREETGQRIKRQSLIGGILVFILFIGLALIPFSSKRSWLIFPDSTWLSWAGVVFCGIGYCLVFWSGLALGRQYSAEVTLQKDHQLITKGPYQLIRHPRYLGLLLTSFGFSLIFHSWLGFLISAIAKTLILSRIHDEEYLLHEHFGKEWEVYYQKSWRLIPLIY
jgi:protein-S-isoprenylcysteine O-methyltransferase Ste14